MLTIELIGKGFPNEWASHFFILIRFFFFWLDLENFQTPRFKVQGLVWCIWSWLSAAVNINRTIYHLWLSRRDFREGRTPEISNKVHNKIMCTQVSGQQHTIIVHRWLVGDYSSCLSIHYYCIEWTFYDGAVEASVNWVVKRGEAELRAYRGVQLCYYNPPASRHPSSILPLAHHYFSLHNSDALSHREMGA